MKVGVLLMVFLVACQAASPTNTLDQCSEARGLWEKNQEQQESLQELDPPDRDRVRWSAEIAAVLAEQYPACFTVLERVNAEATRRFLADR